MNVRMAFQGASGNLIVVNESGIPGNLLMTDTQLGMKTGTSPGMAELQDKSRLVVFQANTGDLWTTKGISQQGVDTKLGMLPSSSPAIAAAVGKILIAFQSNTGVLMTTNGTPQSGVDTKLGMRDRTNPCIALNSSGRPYIAFQSNVQTLVLTDGTPQSGIDTKLGMMDGTSPSIALRRDGKPIIAFQANTGNLWLSSGVPQQGIDTGLRMMRDTSPSIATNFDGSLVVAYQSPQGNLCKTDGTPNQFIDTLFGMMRGTNPSVVSVSEGNPLPVICFQANTGNCWGATGQVRAGMDWMLKMGAGTSPATGVLFTPNPAQPGSGTGPGSYMPPNTQNTVGVYGSIQFFNKTSDQDTLTVWVTKDGVNAIGEIVAPNSFSQVGKLQSHHFYEFFVTSHNTVTDYNNRFGTNVDPNLFNTSITSNFQRSRSTGPFFGNDSGPDLQVDVV